MRMLSPSSGYQLPGSREKALPAILETASRLACPLDFVKYTRPRLDEVFVAYTGHALGDEAAEEPAA